MAQLAKESLLALPMLPIEVKTGASGTLKSLRGFLASHSTGTLWKGA